MDHYRVRLGKESFKFSSTHFTVLSTTSAERLHGHNYQVAVECELDTLGPLAMAFEFNSLKPLIKTLTEKWDEHVLLPSLSSFLKIEEEDVRGEPHWIVNYQSRSYRFPKSDVVMIEAENITSEELARVFAHSLAKMWSESLKMNPTVDTALEKRLQTLLISIEETRGQSASFSLSNPLTRELSSTATTGRT